MKQRMTNDRVKNSSVVCLCVCVHRGSRLTVGNTQTPRQWSW